MFRRRLASFASPGTVRFWIRRVLRGGTPCDLPPARPPAHESPGPAPGPALACRRTPPRPRPPRA
eukprot:13084724-Alexandrium_andersonii.AAC.1